MRAYEAWKDVSPALNHALLESAYVRNKKLYRHLTEEMARQLRQPPKKVLELPRAERHAKFRAVLAMPQFDILTQNLLMSWLLHEESRLMAAFLDALEIPHDGRGCVDQLPETVDETLLKNAVARLYQDFDREKATLYFKTFDTISGRNWGLIEKFVEPVTASASP